MLKKRADSVPQLVNSSLTIFLGRYHPKKRHIKNPPTGNIIFPVIKSNQSNKVFPKKVKDVDLPRDSEQRAPMIQQLTVTNIAPFFLEI